MRWTDDTNLYCNKCNKTYKHTYLKTDGYSCINCGRMKYFTHKLTKSVFSTKKLDYINIETHSFLSEKDSREQ